MIHPRVEKGHRLGWDTIHSSCSSRMVLKILLITGLLGWVKCQEGQSMTVEEKTVIRWRNICKLQQTF